MLNKLVTCSDITFLIKIEGKTDFPTSRSLGPGNFTEGILPNIVKELILILLKLFQKIEEGTFSNSFYRPP